MVSTRCRGCRNHDASCTALHRARRLHLMLMASLVLRCQVLRVELLLSEQGIVLLLVLYDIRGVLLQELVSNYVVGKAIVPEA